MSAKSRHRALHERMTFEADFCLKQRHYNDDWGPHDRPDRIQPRGHELLQNVDQKVALFSRQGIHFTLRPGDENTDPLMAEAATAAIKWELYNPRKRYEEIRERTFLAGIVSRLGVHSAAFYPDQGAFGEILFSEEDARCFAWCDGYLSPHDPRCPWVKHWARVPLAWAKQQAGWKNADRLIADDGTTISRGAPSSPSGGVDLERKGNDLVESDPDQEQVTILLNWERGVSDGLERGPGFGTYPAKDRFMVCGDDDLGGCGYRSATQEVLGEKLAAKGTCPQCGGAATRIDGGIKAATKYPWGHRLTISAPLQPGDDGEPMRELFEGPWPFENHEREMPTVPYCVFTGKDHFWDQVGQSETSTHAHMQLTSDTLMRTAVEQMMLAKPYHVLPRDGATDYKGDPWYFGIDQGLGIFVERDAGDPAAMRTLQSSGIPSGWPAAWDRVQGNFRGNMGTPDLGLTPQETSRARVGSVEAMVDTSRIPADHQTTRFFRAESPFITALLYLIRCTYTEERVTAMQSADGDWGALTIPGNAIPEYDAMVTNSQSLEQMDDREIQNLIQIASQPPSIQKFIARRKGIPITELQQLIEDQRLEREAQMAAQAQQEQMNHQREMERGDQKTSGALAGNLLRSTAGGPGRPAPDTNGKPRGGGRDARSSVNGRNGTSR